MVTLTSPLLSSQSYSATLLADLQSQDLSSENNVVALLSNDQCVLVPSFLLRNVSELLYNLLPSSSGEETTALILPFSPPETLTNLVSVLYSGFVSGLDKSLAYQVTCLAKDLGILMSTERKLRKLCGNKVNAGINDDDSEDVQSVKEGKEDGSSSFDAERYDEQEIFEDKINVKLLELETCIKTAKDSNDLKLFFPKSRLSRDFSKIVGIDNLDGFHGRIQKEYNEHSVGQFMGPYDQHEKLNLCVQLPESKLDYRGYMEFRHDGDTCFEFQLKAYNTHDVLEKVKAYSIKTNSKDKDSNSDQSDCSNEQLSYTCHLEKCVIPCPCPQCHLDQPQCSEHRIEHAKLFNEREHAISIRSSMEFCNDKHFFSNSYIVKYSGIPLNCSRCKRDLLNHHSYHLKFHNNCRFCEQNRFKYKAKTEHKLKQLAEQEIGYYETICPHCDRQFYDSYNVKRHIRNEHTGHSSFKCNFCEKAFQSTTAKVYHERSHQNTDTSVHCDLCKKTFVSDIVLKSHKKCVHSELPREQCPYCDSTFKQKKNLRAHLANIHGIDRSKESYGEDIKEEIFKCDHCDATFGYKKNLNAHMKIKHEDHEEIYKCEECKSTFSNKRTLVEHQKRRHGAQPLEHSCSVCGKVFHQKKVLKKHELLHTK